MLNLKQLNTTVESSTNSNASNIFRESAVDFRIRSSIIGNIGQPLDHGQTKDVLYEDDVDVSEDPALMHSTEDHAHANDTDTMIYREPGQNVA